MGDAAEQERYVGVGQNISQPTGPLADSLLAINYKTGRLRWHKQFTQHDVFGLGNFTGPDADIGASPNLWESGTTEMVGVGQKNGIYHALNAATGKEVWNTRISPGSVFGGAGRRSRSRVWPDHLVAYPARSDLRADQRRSRRGLWVKP